MDAIAQTARRLRLAREAKGLKAKDICERLKISASKYSNWETAQARPQLEAGIRLCDEFGFTLDWLYRGIKAGLPNDLAAGIAALEQAEAAIAREGRSDADNVPGVPAPQVAAGGQKKRANRKKAA